ncbi:hypothetical protein LEP1GSC170_4147 [Leptospira interrogans serovar Bataviae str. HAI135]|nr:hypothetical protein LEP1GSC170_4147 [Leptospira interrogans serovar Bataviae str. HAI135]
MTPTRAVETFILCKKKQESVSEEVILVLVFFSILERDRTYWSSQCFFLFS